MEVAELLPQELIVEILLWLPVKFLLRFRCLSKSFCAIIDSSDFIKMHVSRSSETFGIRKLIFQDRSKKKFHVCDVNVDLQEEILPLENAVSSPWKEVYGYCNGLLLLNRSTLYRKFGLALWNPSTRKYRDLPDCPFKVPADAQFYSIIGSGLGYDESADDYKAFYMVHVQRKGEFEVQVWVYGLKSNVWRRTQNFPYLNHRVDRNPDSPGIGYFTDGSVHWLCGLFSNSYQTDIVAFDVSKESFSLVPQPAFSSVDGVATELHVLEGSLCISYYSDSVLPQTDLYIRKSDAVGQFTWRKLYSVVEPIFLFETVNVLCYSKGGDKVLLDFGMDYLVSYDLEEKSFRKIELDKDPNWDGPIPCLESLVSVGGGA